MKNIIIFAMCFILISGSAIAESVYCPRGYFATTNGRYIYQHFSPEYNKAWAGNDSTGVPINIHLQWNTSTGYSDGHFAVCLFGDEYGSKNVYHFRSLTLPLYPDISDANYGHNWKNNNGIYECKGGSDPLLCPYTKIKPKELN